MPNNTNDFMSADRTSMIDNLNHVSTHLISGYWHLLTVVAAIGLAYYNLFSIKGNDNCLAPLLCDKEVVGYIIIFITLIGSIALWVISEHAISHGFLYRYIQTRVAKIEHVAYKEEQSIKDTTKDPTWLMINNDGKIEQDIAHIQ